MNCPRCKTDVTQQDKYCPSCGLPLEAARSGQKKPGDRKAYEENPTSLVDVNEFKKYMANNESSNSGSVKSSALKASESIAQGNLRSDPRPSGKTSLAGDTQDVSPVAAFHDAPVSDPVDVPLPVTKTSSSTEFYIAAGVAILVLAFVLVLYVL